MALHDIAMGLAGLLVLASLIGLSHNGCDHPSCNETHKRELAKELEARQEREHDRFHSKDYPEANCRWCKR